MSNDTTTLANVQPGGRVRLGDQAERARFEAWVKNHVSSLARAADGEYASNFTHALWSAWRAALSAQPSPGGQAAHCPVKHCGMTYARVPADGRCHACGATVQPSPGGQGEVCIPLPSPGNGEWSDGWNACREAMLRGEGEALPARQPVGEPVAWYYGFSDTGEAGPVTFGVPPGAEAIAWAERHGHTLHYLYAAPPAQAVDLGAVRALLQRRIEQWRSHLPADPGAPGTREIETKGEHDYNNDVRICREGITVMEEVLSKIDSQAVGNG
ncbi:hypothetical protein [Stenotrophomonas maltophilia]|uniref:hypothetical protein n=1 Tax=Stenotrophomonas maltophilia TaxID=40324 RepID=UPI002E75D0D2|nr:hypothetical protein [Stenotrophomonas maltophilia]